MPGMLMSTMTASGAAVLTSRMACAPACASRTWSPSSRRISQSVATVSRSSSQMMSRKLRRSGAELGFILEMELEQLANRAFVVDDQHSAFRDRSLSRNSLLRGHSNLNFLIKPPSQMADHEGTLEESARDECRATGRCQVAMQ